MEKKEARGCSVACHCTVGRRRSFQLRLGGHTMPLRRPAQPLIALVLLLAFAATTAAELCPNPQVPKAQRDAADQLLVLSETEQVEAIQNHLPIGTPQC